MVRFGRRGLHIRPSSSFHCLRSFLVLLGRGGVGPSLGTMVEMVVAANPLDEEELTLVCGAPLTVDGGRFAPRGGARRLRRYRCTPTVLAPHRASAEFAARGWPEGWLWVGEVEQGFGTDSVPPTLTSYFPRLVERAAALGVSAQDLSSRGVGGRLRARQGGRG